MRRITLMLMSTVAAVILLFSYRTSTSGATLSPPATADQAPGIVAEGVTPGPTGVARSRATSKRSATTPPARTSVTVNGTTKQTRYGPVQVQVTITDGKIVSVKALQHPSGNSRSDEINAYALPLLRAEVLDAQDARIDTISGATYTSDGYIGSLQAALDIAHFG
jgi:uncharacterized protein with FMN-binding domain